MKVMQLNETGHFVGIEEADESPLERGVFLIPAGCIEAPDPDPPAGSRARWTGAGWVYEPLPAGVEDGAETPAADPDPGPEEILAGVARAVRAHLDAAARALRYDSIASAVSYADEPAVPQYQAEGRAFRSWRSLVWERCYELLAEVEAGTRAPMTAEAVIAELPVLQLGP
ncbi:hypothetical protein [Rhodobacter sp. NSM]|uniref:hypothetical protein n=1 Tax=Rhodobacter sp. NSM TaxID=3457501 RepID=UPI003FD547E9